MMLHVIDLFIAIWRFFPKAFAIKILHKSFCIVACLHFLKYPNFIYCPNPPKMLYIDKYVVVITVSRSLFYRLRFPQVYIVFNATIIELGGKFCVVCMSWTEAVLKNSKKIKLDFLKTIYYMISDNSKGIHVWFDSNASGKRL